MEKSLHIKTGNLDGVVLFVCILHKVGEIDQVLKCSILRKVMLVRRTNLDWFLGIVWVYLSIITIVEV